MSKIYDIREMPEGTFTISFKFIDLYQREEPIQTEENNSAEYIKGSLYGCWNTINIVTFNDKIVIIQLLTSHPVKWYHKYLLHPGLDITEAIICQYLYWTGIRKTVRKEVTKCDVCKRTKWPTKNTVNCLLINQKKYHGIIYV